jgi:hypothetical protein
MPFIPPSTSHHTLISIRAQAHSSEVQTRLVSSRLVSSNLVSSSCSSTQVTTIPRYRRVKRSPTNTIRNLSQSRQPYQYQEKANTAKYSGNSLLLDLADLLLLRLVCYRSYSASTSQTESRPMTATTNPTSSIHHSIHPSDVDVDVRKEDVDR